ncbi:hypothetical protein SapgrDRAFT_0899 [Saprospira grandis DSM 2844]|uniref:Uncharacterized protein n=1 Tax=Saprospira grandis DSM 2844 TaxID=694433 RepID=J0XUM1_9BACT|nr:hypothetical protein SapgrDRAFT_0899 [Saprospira grandis DSM 2844]
MDNYFCCSFFVLGPPPRFARRRYALGLAIRSALRRLRLLGLACGHPAASLGLRPFGPVDRKTPNLWTKKRATENFSRSF